MLKKNISSRIKNIITLFTGTALAQLITVAASILLARLYLPNDFGVYASFISVSNIFAVIMTARYELSIVIEKKEELANTIVYLCFLIIITLTLSFYILFFSLGDSFLGGIESEKVKDLIPYINSVIITATILSIFNVLNYYSIRVGKYKIISLSLCVKAFVICITQVLFYYFHLTGNGLIIGYIIGCLIGIFPFYKANSENIFKTPFNLKKIKLLSKRFKDFPRYTFPGALANTLSLELNSIFILALFSPAEAGYYFFAHRILGMPLNLIGKSFSQVYFKEATEEKKVTGNSATIFKKTVKELSLISLICFLLGFYFIEDIFVFVFGDDWMLAGTYSKLLLPLFMIRLVSSSLSITITVFEKQKMTLIINVVLLTSLLVIFYLTYRNSWDIISFLRVFTLVNSVLYLLFLLYYFRVACKK